MKKSPFQLDPILIRYLSDIEFKYDQKQNDSSVRNTCVMLNRFESKENVNHGTKERFETFEKFFTSKKALRFLSYENYWNENLSTLNGHPLDQIELCEPYKQIVFEKQLLIEVLDIEVIRKFRTTCELVSFTDEPAGIFVGFENGIFTYGKHIHYKVTSKRGARLCKKLYAFKNNPNQKIKNPFVPLRTLSAITYNLSSSEEVTLNQIKGTEGVIKQINRRLKDKEIPAEIITSGDGVKLYAK